MRVTASPCGLRQRALRLLVLLVLLHGVHGGHPVLAQSARIDVGSAAGLPGQAVQLVVSLNTSGGLMVAATLNDITFNPQVLSLDPSDCRINPATGKTLTVSVVRSTRTARIMRFFVQSIFSAPPVPEGMLYTCTLRIASTAVPGSYALVATNARGFGPTGAEILRVTSTGGEVVVTLVLVPSPTPSPSPTSTPTPSPTPTVDVCPRVATVDPAKGPPGTEVTVSGSCTLLRGGRRAAVYFDDAHLVTITGDALGNYRAVLTVPDAAPSGAHQIRLVAPREIAAAAFEVTAPVVCTGDCDQNDSVTIDDLLHLVAIAFGDAASSSCPSADLNGDGIATIDELLAAVQTALAGCAAAAM